MSSPLEDILGTVVLNGQKTNVAVSAISGSGKKVVGKLVTV